MINLTLSVNYYSFWTSLLSWFIFSFSQEGTGLAHTCECKMQWMGEKCSEPYDACVGFNNPCGSHGMCVPHKGQQTWTCNCDKGWGGKNGYWIKWKRYITAKFLRVWNSTTFEWTSFVLGDFLLFWSEFLEQGSFKKWSFHSFKFRHNGYVITLRCGFTVQTNLMTELVLQYRLVKATNYSFQNKRCSFKTITAEKIRQKLHGVSACFGNTGVI